MIKPELFNQTCFFCKHFRCSTAEPDYSEYTPGCSFTMGCAKCVWDMDPYDCTETELRDYIRTGLTCDKFERVEGE